MQPQGFAEFKDWRESARLRPSNVLDQPGDCETKLSRASGEKRGRNR